VSTSIVPWDEARRDGVLSALGPAAHWTVEQGRATWRVPSDDGERWWRTLVVLAGDEPVAVASAFHPRLHNGHEWAYVEVAPRQRRRGVGALALDALRTALPAGAGRLHAKVAAGSPGQHFAEVCGFEPRHHTAQVHVTVPARATSAAVARSIDDEIVDAWRRYYVAGHDWDPPGNVTDDVWRSLFPPATQVLTTRRTGSITGIGMLVPIAGGAMFAGGPVDRHDPDGTAIATDLLGAAAGPAGGSLVVELDDWMTTLTATIAAWPHEVVDEAFVMAERAPA
jgi:GNAT superfamily N-acetyltransferase